MTQVQMEFLKILRGALRGQMEPVAVSSELLNYAHSHHLDHILGCWEILKDTACGFLSCSDLYAAHGMRLLGKPMGGDTAVVSGESGAVTAGVAVSILKDPVLADVRDALQMDRSARVLFISTEGDTDRENYQKMMLER